MVIGRLAVHCRLVKYDGFTGPYPFNSIDFICLPYAREQESIGGRAAVSTDLGGSPDWRAPVQAALAAAREMLAARDPEPLVVNLNVP